MNDPQAESRAGVRATISSSPAIRIEALCVRYGAATAVRDVTLDVPACSVTAVIGPSGCGKTSLLASLNRLTDLIPNCRVSGSASLGDVDLLDRGADVVQIRRRIGMIFQRPNPFPFTVRRNLDLPLREHGVRDRHERAERVERSLRDVGLWDEVKDRLDRSALVLSGGQRQRLCLARALILRPDVLLLDEPCSALDPISAGVVEDLISDLKRRYAIVLVTHNLGQARRLSDRTAFLWADGDGGRLVEQGDTSRIFDAPLDPLTASYVAGRVG